MLSFSTLGVREGPLKLVALYFHELRSGMESHERTSSLIPTKGVFELLE